MEGKEKHTFNLAGSKPIFSSELGSIQQVTATQFPILKNLSMERLILVPGAIREPHWLANANELSYCITGNVLVSILDTGNVFASFTLTEGEMFYVESGSIHHIENVGDTDATLIIAYRNELPQDFSLHASFGAMTNSVLGNTYNLESSSFASITRSTQPAWIVKRQGPLNIPATAVLPDPHKFNIEGMTPPVLTKFGEAKTARNQFWPALTNIAMYSLVMPDDGMREPHWHPSTVEMGYVETGQARMTVMDPDGKVHTFYLFPGDCYFIPAAYPHQIECLEEPEIHFAIFFDQATPLDIGFETTTTAFSKEVIAATLEVEVDKLPDFGSTPVNTLFVGKVNPADTVEYVKERDVKLNEGLSVTGQ